MQTPRGSADDRRLKNFFIAPEKQFKLAIWAVALGLLFFFGFFGFQLWMFSALIASLSSLIPESSVNLEQMVADSVHWTWIVFGVGSVFFTLILTGVTTVVSHRIYGPAYAIRKHLAAIANGDYAYRTHLRKRDEFKDIAEELNQLSERLEGKGTVSQP